MFLLKDFLDLTRKMSTDVLATKWAFRCLRFFAQTLVNKIPCWDTWTFVNPLSAALLVLQMHVIWVANMPQYSRYVWTLNMSLKHIWTESISFICCFVSSAHFAFTIYLLWNKRQAPRNHRNPPRHHAVPRRSWHLCNSSGLGKQKHLEATRRSLSTRQTKAAGRWSSPPPWRWPRDPVSAAPKPLGSASPADAARRRGVTKEQIVLP